VFDLAIMTGLLPVSPAWLQNFLRPFLASSAK